MRGTIIVLAVCLSVPAGVAAQTRTRAPQPPAPLAKDGRLAEAYEQFLLGHHLEQIDDVMGAIAAYRKAIELDPTAAEIPAELAGLYWRQERADEAIAAGEQALKVDPANAEANRVLGMIYATRFDTNSRAQAQANRADGRTPAPGAIEQDRTKAIQYLEAAIAKPIGEADPTARATLARLQMSVGNFDKAIPLLVDLVKQQPGWQDGPRLLTQAYVAAGRTNDAIELLATRATEDPALLPTLAGIYERGERWNEAADAYARAIERYPRNVELKKSYAAVLLNAGGPANIAAARDTLTTVVAQNRNDTRALYLLSQAHRRFGDLPAAITTARRLIAVQDTSPWGYYALAQAFEEQRDYDAVVNALSPAVDRFHGMRGDHTVELAMLLPHLGFAQQVRGLYEKAVATFEEALRLSPKDLTLATYLGESLMSAKRPAEAVQVIRRARADNPGDLRLARAEAQALRQSGKTDEGVLVLEDAVKAHADDPTAYIALAQLYSDVARGPQAVKLLQDAQTRFPDDTTIAFQLGTVFDKQKRFSDAEATFRQVIAREPDNAAALNYLGYMLADRGERLDESVAFLKKALEIEPDNGSYLDSIGWAYFKQNKLDLAEDNLRRAADQLKANSVIQTHYGELLYKVGKYDEAIAAWNRALAGDGEEIDRPELDKKIKAARQKVKK